MKKMIAMLLALLFLLCGCGQASEEAVSAQTPAATTEAVLETTPPTTEPMGYEDYYQLGLDLAEEYNWEDSIAAFDAAIALDASQPKAYVGRGISYNGTRTQEGFAAATSDFEAALAMDDTLAEAYLGLADTHIRMEDFETAISILRNATEKTQDEALLEKLETMEGGCIIDAGGRTYFKSYYKDGRRITYYVYHWFPDNSGYSVTSYNDSGKQLDYAECLYDDQGRKIQGYSGHDDTGAMYKITYTYDENGNCIRQDSYNDDDTLRSYIEFTYDDAGNRTRQDRYDGDGKKINYTIFQYNDAGQRTNSSQYKGDGTLESYSLTSYNARGQTLEVTIYLGDDTLLSRQVYEYDDTGRHLSTTSYNDKGEVISFTDYTSK